MVLVKPYISCVSVFSWVTGQRNRLSKLLFCLLHIPLHTFFVNYILYSNKLVTGKRVEKKKPTQKKQAMNFYIGDGNGQPSQKVHVWFGSTGSASDKTQSLLLYLDCDLCDSSINKRNLLHDKCIIGIHAALEILAALLKKKIGKHQKNNCFCW